MKYFMKNETWGRLGQVSGIRKMGTWWRKCRGQNA
jgi:hypothetical protein